MSARQARPDFAEPGGRIQIERCRLGLSQKAAAELVGVARGTWRAWEASKSSPSAEQLRVFAEAGADALFIVTGNTLQYASWRGQQPKPFREVVGRDWVATLDGDGRRELMLEWLQMEPGVRRKLLYTWIEFEISLRRHGYKRQLRAVLDILKVELG